MTEKILGFRILLHFKYFAFLQRHKNVRAAIFKSDSWFEKYRPFICQYCMFIC